MKYVSAQENVIVQNAAVSALTRIANKGDARAVAAATGASKQPKVSQAARAGTRQMGRLLNPRM